jgi:protein O-GlcNAc transferase
LVHLAGSCAAQCRKAGEAEEAYRRAIQLDSKYEEAYFNLCVLLQYDRPSEAEALLRRALELDPDYAKAHRQLGWLLHDRKDRRGGHRRRGRRGTAAEAEGHFRRAIELEPGDAWTHIYLGSYLWGDDVDSAIAEFQIARELCPEWTVPLWALGNIHELVLEDFDLAQSYFERALELDPDDIVVLWHLGRLYKKRGQIDLAKECLGKVLLQDTRHRKARALLSEIGHEGSLR